MKRNHALVLAALAVVVLGLMFTAVQAREKSHRHRGSDFGFLAGWGIDQDDFKELRKLEALKGLKIRIDGLKDLERFGRHERARVKIDLDGLREMAEDMGRLGERIGRRVARKVRDIDTRELREALKALRDLKIDIDID